MIYKIEIEKKPQKFIDKQNKEEQNRIYKAIYKLPDGDVKKMQNKQELFRLRVGKYRFIYKIIEEKILIKIINADNRGDIYKRY